MPQQRDDSPNDDELMLATAMLTRCSKLARNRDRELRNNNARIVVDKHLKGHIRTCLSYLNAASNTLHVHPDSDITLENARVYNRNIRSIRDKPTVENNEQLAGNPTQKSVELHQNKLKHKMNKYYLHRASLIRSLHDKGSLQSPDDPLAYVHAERKRLSAMEKQHSWHHPSHASREE